MYKITLINNNIAYTINSQNMSLNSPKIKSGSIVKGINSIGSFSFTILKNNPAFNRLFPYTTQINVYNTKKGKYEFKGRILKIKPSMDSNGLVSKNVICEDRLGFLQDSIQPFLEEKYWQGDDSRTGLEEFIDYILDNHNSQVEDYKKIYRGVVTVKPFENSNNITKNLNYETTWEIISNKLIGSFDGEIQLREKDNKLYLDYLTEIGEEKNTGIILKKNMQSVDREIDPTNFITKLIPLGSKIKKEEIDENGEKREVESEERVTIASVNNDSIFLETPEISSLGSIVKTVIFDDVTVPMNLLKKAKEFLTENNKLSEKHTVKALDLSLIDSEIDDFEVGNYYPIKNELIDLDEKLRIIKKTIDVVEPLSSTFEIGDSKKLLSSLTIEQSKTNMNAIEEIKKDYVKNQNLMNEITKLTSLIKQTSSEILLSVSENYTLQTDYNAVSDRLASLLIQIDSINQTVSSWGDLTATKEEQGVLELKDALKGPIIYLSIHGEINFLYPSNNLYPSNDLYPIDDNLIIEYENGSKDIYQLPFSKLHYLNDDIYDEFIIDDFGTHVVRRVAIDDNNNFYQLEEEIVENYNNIEINLENGLNKIYLTSFPEIFIKTKYAVKNSFSDIYATTVQLNSSISQLAGEINLVVSKKVDSNEIISSINQSAEEIKIAAEKLSLEGKVFDLTADNIKIFGKKLKINSDGVIELFDNNAETVFGNDETQLAYKITSNFTSEYQGQTNSLIQRHSLLSGSRLLEYENDNHISQSSSFGHYFGGIEENVYRYPSTTWYLKSDDYNDGKLEGYYSYVSCGVGNLSMGRVNDGSSEELFRVNDGYVTCKSLVQTSLVDKKKNLEKLDNALEILKAVDIYKYNFKNESELVKKHIGFVIGDNYNYSKEITSSDDEGADIYSMISVLWQVVKEQQEEIEKIKEMMKNG